VSGIVPLCDHPVLFVPVCVIFRPLVIFEASCDVQLHVFTTSPLLCLWCIPIPFKETHENHMSDLCTTIQQFVGRPLPFHTTLLGSAVGNGPTLVFMEAVSDWTSSCVFCLHTHSWETFPPHTNPCRETRAASHWVF